MNRFVLASMTLHGGFFAGLSLLDWENSSVIEFQTIAEVDLLKRNGNVSLMKRHQKRNSVKTSMAEQRENEFDDKATAISQTKDVLTENSNPIRDEGSSSQNLQVGQVGSELNSLVHSNGTNNFSQADEEAFYLSEIKKLLEKNKVYPRSAMALKLQGEVLLSFRIKSDGQIEQIEVVNVAHRILKSAAVELLLSIGKVRQIPEALKKSELLVQVPLEYRLY